MAYTVEQDRPSRSAPYVCPRHARDVAAWFLETPSRPRDSSVRLAYRLLQLQSDQAFFALCAAHPASQVRVVFSSCHDPYTSDGEMIEAVRSTGLLEVTTVATDRGRLHPLLGNEPGGAYDRFRAVHDIVGHVRPGWGFDRDGEFAAWLAQERLYTGAARLALATELHAEHSVRWTTGEVADHKALLFDRPMLDRARRGSFSGWTRTGTGFAVVR